MLNVVCEVSTSAYEGGSSVGVGCEVGGGEAGIDALASAYVGISSFMVGWPGGIGVLVVVCGAVLGISRRVRTTAALGTIIGSWKRLWIHRHHHGAAVILVSILLEVGATADVGAL